ncbi:porin family protein [Fuchsiella alkaliacetigena]|uniref:porin family protein n=1 Tax=Fuchsiella alkaliacetigena TaxID=957042 RepID=UPI00200A49C2|nr:porin family protein [Fuchsiella alkaliacetigena]MCK8825547.1 porin family protein [Fuchsiella alkaliacetigena]
MKNKFLIMVLVVLMLSLVGSIGFANENVEENQEELFGFGEEIPDYSAYAGISYDMLLELSQYNDNNGFGVYAGGRKWINDDVAIGIEGEFITANSEFNHSDFPTEGVNIFSVGGLATYEVSKGIYAIGGIAPYFATFDDGEETYTENTIGLKIGAEANFALTEELNTVARAIYRGAEVDLDVGNAKFSDIDIGGAQLAIGITRGF